MPWNGNRPASLFPEGTMAAAPFRLMHFIAVTFQHFTQFVKTHILWQRAYLFNSLSHFDIIIISDAVKYLQIWAPAQICNVKIYFSHLPPYHHYKWCHIRCQSNFMHQQKIFPLHYLPCHLAPDALLPAACQKEHHNKSKRPQERYGCRCFPIG